MSREHHVVEAIRRSRPVFLLWFSGEADGLLTDGTDRLHVFSSADDARAHATAGSLALDPDDASRFDLDALESWIEAPDQATLGSTSILDAWNLLTDVARSVGDELATARLLQRATLPAYDRLVSTCNLPALGILSGVGALDDEDRRTIAATLRDGLACFDRAIGAAQASR